MGYTGSMIADGWVDIHQGNALVVLATLPPESVDCCITSPPYWGLRKYSGQQDLVWDAAEGCEHAWLAWDKTQAFTLKAKGIALPVKQGCQSMRISNREIKAKGTALSIDMGTETAENQKVTKSLDKGITTGGKGNSLNLVNGTIPVENTSQEIPNIGQRNRGEIGAEALTGEQSQIVKSLNCGDRPRMNPKGGPSVSCLLGADGGSPQTITDECRQVFIKRDEANISILSDTSISNHQAENIGTPSSPLIKEGQSIFSSESPSTERRASSFVPASKPPLGPINEFPTNTARDLTSSVPIGTGQSPMVSHIYSICQKCGAVKGSYGLEPMPDCGRPNGEFCSSCYICHTLVFLRAIRRVLKPTGTVWLNLGDSYAANRSYQVPDSKWVDVGNSKGSKVPPGLKPLDLCLIPQRVAVEAQRDGWWVRSIIIWNKPNPMPESIRGWFFTKHRVKVAKSERAANEYQTGAGTKQGPGVASRKQREAYFENGIGSTKWADCPGCPKCLPHDGLVLRKGSWRPTESHEYIIMLTKTDSYYGDGEDVREAQVTPLDDKSNHTFGAPGGKAELIYGEKHLVSGKRWRPNSSGRNLRSVWTFPTAPFPSAHFATFPKELPQRCILASTSAKGNCPKCGAPWARVVEKVKIDNPTQAMRVAGCNRDGGYEGEDLADYQSGQAQSPSDTKRRILESMSKATQTTAWRATCSCGEKPVPAVVLDCFAGSGTVGMVAKSLGRRAILIDTSEDYCRMAAKRVGEVSLPMVL